MSKLFTAYRPTRQVCKEALLLLAIEFLTSHVDRRQAIRESWGKETSVGNQTVVGVFLLGQTPAEDNHPDLSDVLKFESEKHQDILLWNYRDTFFNLSLKEVLFLRWVSTSCPFKCRVLVQGR
ncbi:unnamed protein product [Rangifer tarandus platyrhynchus]|uniref:Uncharacterized protein n=1 Tax=Rangifer tarandus platyrhynchus TaxID=3082113 RepID=A0AC59YK47_RANTA